MSCFLCLVFLFFTLVLFLVCVMPLLCVCLPACVWTPACHYDYYVLDCPYKGHGAFHHLVGRFCDAIIHFIRFCLALCLIMGWFGSVSDRILMGSGQFPTPNLMMWFQSGQTSQAAFGFGPGPQGLLQLYASEQHGCNHQPVCQRLVRMCCRDS